MPHIDLVKFPLPDNLTLEISPEGRLQIKAEGVRTEHLIDSILSADAKGRAKMADGFLTNLKLEAWLRHDADLLFTYILNGTAKLFYAEETATWLTCFPDIYTDLAIQTYHAQTGTHTSHPLNARITDRRNFYLQYLWPGATTADHQLQKIVAGSGILLGSEAADIDPLNIASYKLSCKGSTIKAYRADLVTPRITVTDTTFTSGYFGIGQWKGDFNRALSVETWIYAKKVPASSPSPQPIGYFEVPIIGDGSLENPFRPQMPEFIEEIPIIGKTNRFALSYSALIPTDDKGKPLHQTALVRIFEQPDRQPHLAPTEICISELKALKGIRDIGPSRAKRMAKGMDKKLKDEDLTIDGGWG